MASSFTLVTRAAVPVEQLFDVSLSIDEHVASMDQVGRAGDRRCHRAGRSGSVRW